MYSLEGKVIEKEDFIKWIKEAEISQTMDFAEFKRQWAEKREKFQKLIHSN